MIIGLAGVKQSGKNTVASFIDRLYGEDYQVTEWSFAEDLKISAAESLGVSSDHIEFCNLLKEHSTIEIHLGFTIGNKANGEQGDIATLSGREFLQWYGTEAHRDVFGDDFWVDNLLKKIHVANYGSGLATEERLDIITDVRFPNEAEAIRGVGYLGDIIQIRRPSVENSGDTHASEKPLDGSLVDYVIWNEASFQELQTQVVGTLSHILNHG